MKQRKIIATIIIIVAAGLLVAGGILLFQNYSNKNRIITSFEELKQGLTDTFNLGKDSTNKPLKQTVQGNTTFNINSMFGNSSDGSDIIINNLNNSSFNYNYIIDTDSKKLYLDGSLLFNGSELLGLNYYQAEDISYILLRNIFDKYITIENTDVFSYLEESKKLNDDINYVYDKVIESLGKNIIESDIKVTSDNGKKKITLKLNNQRLTEIAENIIVDLKNDSKIKEILDDELNDITLSTNTSNANDTLISYSIYLEKNDITSYEFRIKDNEDDYTFTFNRSDKSIAIKKGNEEIIKADIEENNNTITVNLSTNNTNIGSIIISENNIALNIIDVTSRVSLNATLTTNTINNTTNKDFKLSLTTNGINFDLMSINDTQTIISNEADFSNINTTNNVNINNLTNEEITTIQNNFAIILYRFMGYSI